MLQNEVIYSEPRRKRETAAFNRWVAQGDPAACALHAEAYERTHGMPLPPRETEPSASRSTGVEPEAIQVNAQAASTLSLDELYARNHRFQERDLNMQKAAVLEADPGTELRRMRELALDRLEGKPDLGLAR